MSLDVLLFVPDQAAALREVARILRADGLFAFTSWEQSGYSARLGALQVADYRPLLEAAGFAAEVYEEPLDWQRHQRALAEGIIAVVRHQDCVLRGLRRQLAGSDREIGGMWCR